MIRPVRRRPRRWPRGGRGGLPHGGLHGRVTSTSCSSTTPSRRASSTSWSPTASPTWDEVGALAESGELARGGRLPCNTAGGLLSEGHLSGFGHVAEAVRQIRGTSPCQVPRRRALDGDRLRRRAARAAADRRLHRRHPARMTTRRATSTSTASACTSREAGAGPALILLHGLTATHANWEHTIPAFADRWRVVAPDLPGHGRSAKPDAPYTIDFYAGVIRSLGRALGIDEAVVVGNSLGGQIAVEMGLAYPTWTRALVLVAPAGGLRRTDAGPPLGARAGGAARARCAWRSRWALDRCFLRPARRVVRAPAAAPRRAARAATTTRPSRARSRARSSVRSPVPASRSAALTQPTLVVWGRRRSRHSALRAAGGCCATFPRRSSRCSSAAGHLPMVEAARGLQSRT